MRAGIAAMGIGLLAPLLGATAFVLCIAGGELSGHAPLSQDWTPNIAEAAALGQGAAVMRYLRYGENPERTYPVRAGVMEPTSLHVTANEAAVWSRRLDTVMLLDREGGIVGTDSRRHLACLARDLELPDVAAYLAPGEAACVAGAARALVLRRGQGPS